MLVGMTLMRALGVSITAITAIPQPPTQAMPMLSPIAWHSSCICAHAKLCKLNSLCILQYCTAWGEHSNMHCTLVWFPAL